MSDLGETPARSTADPIAEQIADVFRSAGARGFLHAREVGTPNGPEVAVGADEPVVLASVFKIAVAVAYAREVVWSSTVLDPRRTNASTPRDMTVLLDSIWTDRAAEPEACAKVREMMSHQIWPHRLTAGFESGVVVAGKTGTLPAVRNEAGVVTYPDGRQFAVAVFTRANSLSERLPAVDASIARAARLAVDHLRTH